MKTEVIQYTDGLVCEACDAAYTTYEGGPPVYECGTDGEFVGHEGNRCAECNKFASKSADYSCPVCEGPMEAVDQLVLDPETGYVFIDVERLRQAQHERKPEVQKERIKKEKAAKRESDEFEEKYWAEREAEWARRDGILSRLRAILLLMTPEDRGGFLNLHEQFMDARFDKEARNVGETISIGWGELEQILDLIDRGRDDS